MRTLISVAVFCGLGAVLHAQGTQVAQVSGRVTDSTGLAVPDAQVTITNTGTGIARQTTTAQDGAYLVTSLPVGPYRLQVFKDGFTAYVQSGITLQVNTNPEIDVTLKIGTVSEQVVVEANAARRAAMVWGR